MARRIRHRVSDFPATQLAIMLSVAAGLLSLGPTDSFLSSPLISASMRVGTFSGAEPGRGEARAMSTPTLASTEAKSRCMRRDPLRMSGVAEDQVVEVAKDVPVTNVKPFVVTPRRDPKVWFEAVMDGAPPRPEALVDLSKAGVAQLDSLLLPTRKQEPFRYTDLESLYRTDFTVPPADCVGSEAAIKDKIAPLLLEESKGQQMIFVNGIFSAALSDTSALDGVEGLVAGHLGSVDDTQLGQVKEMLAYLPETDADYRTSQGSLPFCSLNQACFTDAAVILVADGVRIEKPLQVIFFSDGLEGPTVSHPRMVVKAGKDSHLRLAQSYLSQGGLCFANGFTRVLVGDRADVVHDYLEELREADRMVDTVSVDQRVNSTYSINQVLVGGFDTRANLQIDLQETGSHCNVFTAALTTSNQRQDTHTTIQHKAEGTTCLQEQRNIVADKADCVFKGRIVIDQIAQKTDANQLCRTLLVSDKARVTVMPSMEIIANDVKCTHGATISDLEDEELFYLMARGINRIEAKTLVIKSFADIVVKRFADARLRDRILPKLLSAAPRDERAVKGEYRSI